MLRLNVGGKDEYDSTENLFYRTEDDIYVLNHCLYAIAQWESKWKKPFFTNDKLEYDEMADYIQCMCFDRTIDLSKIGSIELKQINEYINDSRTATTVKDSGGSGRGSFMSSEVLYAQMCIAEVDWEAQYWHISRLNKLLQVIADMKSEKKPMDRRAILKQNAALNEQRKRELKSKG